MDVHWSTNGRLSWSLIAATQTSAGTLNLELGGLTPGSQHDQLVVTSPVTLDGALNVTLLNGFRPAPGDLFAILACGSRIGQFASTSELVPRLASFNS